MERYSLWCLLLCLLPTDSVYTYTVPSHRIVRIRPTPNFKYVSFPSSNEGVLIWMQIFKGIFPNLESSSFVGIGQPVSILVSLLDYSDTYSIDIDECWAHDEPSLDFSKYLLSLSGQYLKSKTKILNDWQKFRIPTEHKTLLYANFTSFGFPDKDELFLACNVEIDKSLGSIITNVWHR
ncbi:hypothetical protein JTB14_026138 [Gonioctena quinquepunctata]|nr:hypothetical protein JTB14_026138 [Gonioctena quinquepunctata]